MYLKKLRLKNYKCYNDLDIDFHEKMNVLLGNNGAGKSTILQAASIAISTMFQPYEGVSSTGIKANDVRQEVFTVGEDEDVNSIFPSEIEAEAMIDGNEIKWRRSLNSEKGSTTIVDAKSIIGVAKKYNERLKKGDVELILPIMLYYGTGRLYDCHREKKSDVFKKANRLNGYIDSLDGTANIKMINTWFKSKTVEKYERMEAGRSEDPAITVVLNAMERLYMMASGNNSVKIQYSMTRRELVIWYTSENNKRECLSISQLSEGYRNTLLLIADIAYRMTILNPNLKEKALEETPGIIMIDEVDQHLHPFWQQRIIDELAEIFPKVQFIVTTHAPSVVNTVKKESIRILSDYQVEEVTIETYGMDNNGVIETVMDALKRPEKVEMMIREFYDALDDEKLDKAQILLENLKNTIGNDDPEIITCSMKLDFARM